MACPSRTRTDAGSPGCLDKNFSSICRSGQGHLSGENFLRWMGPHASLCSESNVQIWLDPSCSHVGQKWAVLVSNIGHLPVVVKLVWHVGSYQTRSPHELQVESDSIRAIRTANRTSPLQAHREEYTPGHRR